MSIDWDGAVAFLGSGLAVVITASVGLNVGLPFMGVLVSFLLVAVAILVLLKFRVRAFVAVWAAAVVTVLSILGSIDSSLGLEVVAASVLFGSCAMILWLAVALPIRVLLRSHGTR